MEVAVVAAPWASVQRRPCFSNVDNTLEPWQCPCLLIPIP